LASIPTPLRSAGSADWPAKESAWTWLPSFRPQVPPVLVAGVTPALRKLQGPTAGVEVVAVGVTPEVPGFWLRTTSAMTTPTMPTTATAIMMAPIRRRLGRPPPALVAARSRVGGRGA